MTATEYKLTMLVGLTNGVFMYSILPIIAAILFLAYGLYIILTKGANRITIAFFIICLTTFFWQFTWAILFQIEDESLAITLIKIGWLPILFLPTSLYHFLVEITDRNSDRKIVYLSYTLSLVFSIFLITSNHLINGYHEFFFGFYPKADVLHPLHMIQTFAVIIRGLYITNQKKKVAENGEKEKLKFCTLGISIYFFAATDYMCNYGVEFYPIGILFICISLGIIATVTGRHRVMDNTKTFESLLISASAGHEMRAPLSILQSHTKVLSDYMPELIKSYNKIENKKISNNILHKLSTITQDMNIETQTINRNIDSLLTLTSYDFLNERDFHYFSVKESIDDAIKKTGIEEKFLSAKPEAEECDFVIYASKTFLTFVIVNLIKNAKDSIKEKNSGKINISVHAEQRKKSIIIMDTGIGIEKDITPYIFDKFFTTKNRDYNIGIGLAFSRSVMQSFGGSIECESTLGKHTKFTLTFNL